MIAFSTLVEPQCGQATSLRFDLLVVGAESGKPAFEIVARESQTSA